MCLRKEKEMVWNSIRTSGQRACCYLSDVLTKHSIWIYSSTTLYFLSNSLWLWIPEHKIIISVTLNWFMSGLVHNNHYFKAEISCEIIEFSVQWKHLEFKTLNSKLLPILAFRMRHFVYDQFKSPLALTVYCLLPPLSISWPHSQCPMQLLKWKWAYECPLPRPWCRTWPRPLNDLLLALCFHVAFHVFPVELHETHTLPLLPSGSHWTMCVCERYRKIQREWKL